MSCVICLWRFDFFSIKYKVTKKGVDQKSKEFIVLEY